MGGQARRKGGAMAEDLFKELANGWIAIAVSNLENAESALADDDSAGAIDASYRAMACMVRGLLCLKDVECASDDELPGLYSNEVLPGLEVSIENQRAFTIVRNLWERVEVTGEEAGDPLTARACLEDAKNFVDELRGKAEQLGETSDGSDGEAIR